MTNPYYPFSPPVLAPGACERYMPCGKSDCKKCFPGQIVPSHLRGSKKPGGGGSKRTLAEQGYRVVSYDDMLNAAEGSKPGETFSIPDLAIASARRKAKATKKAHLIYRHGAEWQTIHGDGTVAEHEDTRP